MAEGIPGGGYQQHDGTKADPRAGRSEEGEVGRPLGQCDLDADKPRHDAVEVLRRISRSLRPWGMFVLDVYAPHFFATLDGEQEWWVGHDFIAGRFPQLVLTEYFYYARDKTYARRDFIFDARTGAIHTFGVSGQAYTLPELCGLIAAAGCSPTIVYGSWQGEEATSDSQMYIVLATR